MENRPIFVEGCQGGISRDNLRLINQSHLGFLRPDFMPQLALPSRESLEFAREIGGYPMQRILGVTLHFFCCREPAVPLKDHVLIALISLAQLQSLLRDFGVVLGDRHDENIMLSPTPEASPLRIEGEYQRVYQVDFDHVYDAVLHRGFLGGEIDLTKRKGPHRFVKPEKTREQVSYVTYQLLQNLETPMMYHPEASVLYQGLEVLLELWGERRYRGDPSKMTFSRLSRELGALLKRDEDNKRGW